MAAVIVDGLRVPPVRGLDEFRDWIDALGEGAPRASYVDGEVWLEMSPQDYRTHQPLVDEVNSVLRALAIAHDLGRYFYPPSWITSVAARLSTEPDGFFARWDTLRSGRLQISATRSHELVGVPDFAFEAVSAHSASKDLIKLRADYAVAGIGEYWIADGRQEPQLTMLVLEGQAYQEVGVDGEGWTRSPLWGRSFRLERVTDPAGLPDYRLRSG